jgi:hypothetical protein
MRIPELVQDGSASGREGCGRGLDAAWRAGHEEADAAVSQAVRLQPDPVLRAGYWLKQHRFGDDDETRAKCAPRQGDRNSKETIMRAFTFLALTSLTLVFAGSIRVNAAEAWCARFLYGQGTNCGFATFEQCEADISGVGGYCAQNPAWAGHGGRDPASTIEHHRQR